MIHEWLVMEMGVEIVLEDLNDNIQSGCYVFNTLDITVLPTISSPFRIYNKDFIFV